MNALEEVEVIDDKLTSFELFAGAGGLALGAQLAGFHSLGTIEWDRWACQTIRKNQNLGHPLVKNWRVHEMDVRDYPWDAVSGDIDLLAGGPPCQPFSLGGNGRAQNDKRDMFPAMISAVRKVKPRAFVVENVKGLLRSQFSDYYQYILLRLEFPEREIGQDESWVDHLRRLQKAKSSAPQPCSELTYNVIPTLVNAADYGVPQRRDRVFIVGFRSDLKVKWAFPDPTHSRQALAWAQRAGGEYWDRHGIIPKKAVHVGAKPTDCRLPWVTVRDALRGMPEPTDLGDKLFFDHVLKRGAKVYPGHTGSQLDAPSKALKAGVHGVPGGENMLIRDDGSPRYYTVREAARIQTFPDGYRLDGAWSEAMRQLGNAVPVLLAQKVMSSVAQALIENEIAYRTSQAEKRESLWVS